MTIIGRGREEEVRGVEVGGRTEGPKELGRKCDLICRPEGASDLARQGGPEEGCRSIQSKGGRSVGQDMMVAGFIVSLEMHVKKRWLVSLQLKGRMRPGSVSSVRSSWLCHVLETLKKGRQAILISDVSMAFRTTRNKYQKLTQSKATECWY
jgi:hypothetical protein